MAGDYALEHLASGSVVVNGGMISPQSNIQQDAASLSREDFMTLFTSTVVASAAADINAVSSSATNHVVHGHHSGGTRNHNAVGIEGPSSDLNASDPGQSPNATSASSTPPLTPDANSPSSSLNANSPLSPVAENVSEDNGVSSIDWSTPDNLQLLQQIRATLEDIEKSANNTQGVIRNTHGGGRVAPYPRPQAVATGADLSQHNPISTNAAFTGGVQSGDVGGIVSADYRAAQMPIAPIIEPSHMHSTEMVPATQEQEGVRTGLWSNPPLEAGMASIAIHSLNNMAFRRDTNHRECSFMLRDPDGNNFTSCGMLFKDKRLRDRHVQSCHLETLKMVCGLCVKDRVFARPDSLRRHIVEATCAVTKQWKKENGEVWLREKLVSMGYTFRGAYAKKSA